MTTGTFAAGGAGAIAVTGVFAPAWGIVVEVVSVDLDGGTIAAPRVFARVVVTAFVVAGVIVVVVVSAVGMAVAVGAAGVASSGRGLVFST